MNLFSQLYNAVQNGIAVSLITLVACPHCRKGNEGQMLLLYADGRAEGLLINESFTEYVVRTVEQLTWKQPTVIDLDYENLQGYQLFWDQPSKTHKVLIFGAGHISRHLVEVLAMLNYEITVVDDRPDFANKHRFPKANQVLLQSFKQALAELCPNVDAHTAIIIVTRGHQYDLQCLRAAINTRAGYLGMIGSKSRVRETLRLLYEEGVAEASLKKIRAPIGLDIGAQTPTEIALSIATEVVSVFNCRPGRPMSITGGIRHEWQIVADNQ
ncbi:XdhC family protein [Sporomusa acidovorans]|uniref:XdhC Rossmann domain-containing protein n=1 Tax=Sporomusa acidovorans (strain ATCC 49682 / DSM 3132 / Mol) TaxID=1123286 RepID=A0ABZ3J347_SPOA4|nr:XdhC family protein [Sporomusa acidovorans]OZC19976.1 putative xanthine dehydrogenase subunit A [Sporomusa acidovorans DSM 3132]SDD48627.1 xanthine dehydrogenase accessory factor [Sporomusa acidovorans]